jgi:hypothetical protein
VSSTVLFRKTILPCLPALSRFYSLTWVALGVSIRECKEPQQ